MMMTEVIAGRSVEVETADIEPVRVRVLPNGNMDIPQQRTDSGVRVYDR